MLCNAKINLFLHVTGKYDNNYHELESLMVPVNLHDKLEIKLSDNANSLAICGEFAHLVEQSNNIVITTINKIFEHVGQKSANFNITLEKNIPVGAGLGGGSSNAAATLHMVNDIMSFGLSNSELKEIALTIGADVPFFIDNKPCFATGIGEVCYFVQLPDLNILLVFPNTGLNTAKVFNYAPIEFEQKRNFKASFESKNDLVEYLLQSTNSLEKNSIRLVNDVEKIINTINLQDGCLLSRMSGSGSCCFGIFDNNNYLRKAAANIKKSNPNWWISDLNNN